MSVLGYLQERASEAVLSEQEKLSIDRSIGNLQQKLEAYFVENLSQHFRFGSTTRGTNLPRSLDELADVDYMVVFSDSDKSPQTYLDRLRGFVEANYPRSVVRQDHPTIVLELSHIKLTWCRRWIAGGRDCRSPTKAALGKVPTRPPSTDS